MINCEEGSGNLATDNPHSIQTDSISTKEVSTKQPFIIGMWIFNLSDFDYIIFGHVEN